MQRIRKAMALIGELHDIMGSVTEDTSLDQLRDLKEIFDEKTAALGAELDTMGALCGTAPEGQPYSMFVPFIGDVPLDIQGVLGLLDSLDDDRKDHLLSQLKLREPSVYNIVEQYRHKNKLE